MHDKLCWNTAMSTPGSVEGDGLRNEHGRIGVGEHRLRAMHLCTTVSGTGNGQQGVGCGGEPAAATTTCPLLSWPLKRNSKLSQRQSKIAADC